MSLSDTTSYPGGLDVLPELSAVGGDMLNTTGKEHDAFHDKLAKAVVALEAKVGLGSSTDVTSVDYKVNQFIFLRPTGVAATDTPAWQAAVALAQSTGKPLYVGGGTLSLTAGASTTQSFDQPLIFGLGKKFTTVSCSAAVPIITFVGGSGIANGGGIGQATLTGSTATGVRCFGTTGVHMSDLRFHTIARGVVFSNDAASTFTEFNVAERCNFESTCVLAIEYEQGVGLNSNHGSGFRACVFVQSASATTEIIKVGANCLVYNAPWDGTFFLQTSGVAVVRNYSTNAAIVHGSLQIEPGAAVGPFVHASSVAPVYYVGGVSALGENTTFYPKFIQCSRAQYNADGSITTQRTPFNVKKVLAAGATTLLTALEATIPGKHALVSVSIIGSGYEYGYLLVWHQYPVLGGGSVTSLANTEALNGGSAPGAPVFSVDGSGNLIVTNAGYSSSFTAYIGVSEMGTWWAHPIV